MVKQYIIKNKLRNSMEEETLDSHLNISLNSTVCGLTHDDIVYEWNEKWAKAKNRLYNK